MSRNRHVVVMARKPELGRVKTRLADSLGDQAALSFYARTLKRLLKRVGQDGRWKTVLAVTPACEAARPGLWTRGLPVIPQVEGDLGRRMQAAFDVLAPGPVVLVGSDIPDLGARHVASAFRALETHDAVFGPSDDGGYWLIGIGGVLRDSRIFGSVRWSSPHALEDTMQGLPGAPRVAMLGVLADIDTAQDLLRWRCGAKGGYGDQEADT